MSADDSLVKDNEMGIFNVFKYMFSEWVAECSYDTDQMQKANAGRFVEWCRSHWQEKITDCWCELEKRLFANSDCYSWATQLLKDDWRVWQALFAWWPMLSLAGREPLKHQPTLMHVSITVGFNDNKAVQFVIPTINSGQQHFKHDGPICTLLRVQANQAIEAIMDNGLDKLYEKHAVEIKSTDLPGVN